MSKKPSITGQECQENYVMVSDAIVEASTRERALLRGLLVVGSGFSPRMAGRFKPELKKNAAALMLYCVGGAGWCEIAGRLHPLRLGDLLVVAPDMSSDIGAHVTNPWTIHWAQCVGTLLPAYFKELGLENGVLHVGEDPQLIRLFTDMHRSLQKGSAFTHLLRASHAFALLLAVLIDNRYKSGLPNSDSVQKVAETVIYMSEHLKESLRMSALARMVGLSPTYFGELFKEQTGCSPRDYLHLLRIHRACQLLQSTTLNVKQIATEVGYQDQFHFSRQFKAFEGVSPTEYRQRR